MFWPDLSCLSVCHKPFLPDPFPERARNSQFGMRLLVSLAFIIGISVAAPTPVRWGFRKFKFKLYTQPGSLDTCAWRWSLWRIYSPERWWLTESFILILDPQHGARDDAEKRYESKGLETRQPSQRETKTPGIALQVRQNGAGSGPPRKPGVEVEVVDWWVIRMISASILGLWSVSLCWVVISLRSSLGIQVKNNSVC